MLRFSFQIRCGLRLNRGWAGFHAGSAIAGTGGVGCWPNGARVAKGASPEHHSLRFFDRARMRSGNIQVWKLSRAGNPTASLNVQIAAAHERIKIGLCAGAEYGPANDGSRSDFAEVAAKITAAIATAMDLIRNEERQGNRRSKVAAAAINWWTENCIPPSSYDNCGDASTAYPIRLLMQYGAHCSRRMPVVAKFGSPWAAARLDRLFPCRSSFRIRSIASPIAP